MHSCSEERQRLKNLERCDEFYPGVFISSFLVATDSVHSADDPFLADSIAAMVNFRKVKTLGNFLVDFIPVRM